MTNQARNGPAPVLPVRSSAPAAALAGLRDEFRQVMARVASPVSVITTMTEDGPRGTTVSAFSSLSMEPPLVMGALDLKSELLAALRTSDRFGVNVLGAHQSAAALAFASKLGSDKFAGVGWSLDAGAPRLDGAPGWLVCDVVELLPGGDHVIVVGAVREAETAAAEPLVYHDRTFNTCSSLAGRGAAS